MAKLHIDYSDINSILAPLGPMYEITKSALGILNVHGTEKTDKQALQLMSVAREYLRESVAAMDSLFTDHARETQCDHRQKER